LREEVASWLSGAKRVVVVGVGSPIRSDDAVGMAIVEGLRGKVPRSVKLLACETSPESYTSVIKRHRPTHVLIIDAADIQSRPGDAQLVDPQRTVGSMVSTHTLPLKVFSAYIEQTTGASVRLLAIQPQSIAFGTGMTKALSDAAADISKMLIDVLHALFAREGATTR
jgi:hydrogenase 3 maturation protease